MTALWIASLLLPLTLSSAFDTIKQLESRIELDALVENVAHLQQTVDAFHVTVTDHGCPVCVDGTETNRVIQETLSKARGLIPATSKLSRLEQVMRTKRGRRRYHRTVSVEALVPLLQATSSQWSAVTTLVQTFKFKASHDPTSFRLELLDWLEVVATLSDTLLRGVTHLLASANTSAGTVVTSVLALLDFYERVTLASTTVMMNYLDVWTGHSSPEILPDGVHALRQAVSTNTSGVFASIQTFLTAQGDQTGLLAVLHQTSANLTTVERCLDRFIVQADAAMATQNTSAFQNETIDMVGLISRVVAPTVTSVNSLVLASVQVADVVFGSVLGLLVTRINGIHNRFVTTLGSAVKLLVQPQRGTTPVSGDVLFLLYCSSQVPLPGSDPDATLPDTRWVYCLVIGLIPLAILTSPIWLTILVIAFIYIAIRNAVKDILDPNGKAASNFPFACQLESLTCQTNALSKALPTL